MLMLVLVAASVDAPVTSVTVFSDQAAVTRTASLKLSGSRRVELPLLPGAVDPSSIRVEASGAEVQRIDIAPVEDDAFAPDEARKLLDELGRLEDELTKERAVLGAYQWQLQLLGAVKPAPDDTPNRPRPRLNPSGWASALGFFSARTEQLQAKERESEARVKELEERLAHAREKARLLGGAARRSGFRVAAEVSGSGSATLSMTYTAKRARWYPVYELQLLPDAGRVQVSFSGLVSQETGEDWDGAKLTLSTAVPATSTAFRKPATWKIGERERFIPTPNRLVPPAKPPPQVPAPVSTEPEAEVLRARLLAASQGQEPTPSKGDRTQQVRQMLAFVQQLRAEAAQAGDAVRLRCIQQRLSELQRLPPMIEQAEAAAQSATEPSIRQQQLAHADALLQRALQLEGQARACVGHHRDEPSRSLRPTSKSSGDMAPAAAPPVEARDEEDLTVHAVESAPGSFFSGLFSESTPQPVSEMSLSPPAAYRPPSYAADLPASLAGGYDLAYASIRPETVKSGKGARRVALFSGSWPVSVERKLYPALTSDAYLVAEIKSPAKQPLPGGAAQLFVGADPAGVARLSLMSPGEPFTLPLGIDRALKPIRNVKLEQGERGLLGGDELTEYTVTIELANPYRAAVPVRILDQWPVTDEKDVEVKLLETKPYAIQDKVKGTLEWRISAPPSGKSSVSFRYSIRRPKGWRLHQ